MRSSPAALLSGILILVAACATLRLPPPDDAPPTVVARAYLDALAAGDCAATAALLTEGDPTGRDLCGTGHVDGWRGLDGPAGSDSDVSFFVTLVLRDMPRTSGLEDGESGLFLNLVTDSLGRWRVTGLGSGP
jgi:hypothetical protein